MAKARLIFDGSVPVRINSASKPPRKWGRATELSPEKPADTFRRILAEWDGERVLAWVEEAPFYGLMGNRRWRFDFLLPSVQGRDVVFEIEGGTWIQGRHSRPGGYADDCAKYNEAVVCGYKVYRLTTEMAKDEAYVKGLLTYITTGKGYVKWSPPTRRRKPPSKSSAPTSPRRSGTTPSSPTGPSSP